MSANIDTMLYVGETPWHGLGTQYAEPPKSAAEIIAGANLEWDVNVSRMKTDLHGEIGGYHAVYREDNNEVLGVVNAMYPNLVQNSETFTAFDSIIDDKVDVETAASLGRGEKVFGCFKVREQYKLVDDDIDHYFVVFNDHLKVDGKVTVLNTPIRVVCQNTLSAALSNNIYKLRIPITANTGVVAEITDKLMYSVERTSAYMNKKAEQMLKQKISKEDMLKILDELFPYTTSDTLLGSSRANEATDLMRNTFLTQCMGADNLANYAGTSYQVFNALTDFTQHYHKKIDKAYDLSYRMRAIPGMGLESEASKVAKFLNIKDKLIA